MQDAGVKYTDIEQAVVGYVYGERERKINLYQKVILFLSGDSTCGQRAVYQLGLTGIPVYNVSSLTLTTEI